MYVRAQLYVTAPLTSSVMDDVDSSMLPAAQVQNMAVVNGDFTL